MQVVKCPRCAADNSVRREGCFNCGTDLRAPSAPAGKSPETAWPAPRENVEVDWIPGFAHTGWPYIIGMLSGGLAIPFGVALLCSRRPGRRELGGKLLVGLGIIIAAWLALLYAGIVMVHS